MAFIDAMTNTENPTTNAPTPKWIRLPRPKEVCPYSGLRRGQLLNLSKDPSTGIRICHLRADGAKRGSRLIDLESLLSYLDERATLAGE
jgi:hypothetical protein